MESRDHAPAHFPLIRRIVRAKRLDQTALLEGNGNDEIQRADHRKDEPGAGHLRSAEHEQGPAEVERMTDETVDTVGLQGSPEGLRSTTHHHLSHAGQVEHIQSSRPYEGDDDPTCLHAVSEPSPPAVQLPDDPGNWLPPPTDEDEERAGDQ